MFLRPFTGTVWLFTAAAFAITFAAAVVTMHFSKALFPLYENLADSIKKDYVIREIGFPIRRADLSSNPKSGLVRLQLDSDPKSAVRILESMVGPEKFKHPPFPKPGWESPNFIWETSVLKRI